MLTAIIGDLTLDVAYDKIDDLVQLSRDTYAEFAEAPWSKENFLYELHLKWQLSNYAESEGSLVACLIGYQRINDYGPDSEEPFAFIPAIMIKHDFRGGKARTADGKKLSHAMMERYHNKCVDFGIRESRLGVLPDNTSAIKLYELFGYSVIGEQKGVDDRMRLVMSRFFW